MRTPSSALPASPKGLAEGSGRENAPAPLPTPGFFATAGFFITMGFLAEAAGRFVADLILGPAALAFFAAPFLTTAFFAAGFTIRWAMSPLRNGSIRSFLAKFALRVEIANAAALAAGGRIDHRIDKGRLAGIHGFVHGAFEFVG